MDCLAGDPLAHLELTNNAYAEAVQMVMGFGRPVLATGGGGYHVDNTVRGWALAWRVMCGEESGAGEEAMGLGGVMLETADWHGGLRDRARIPDAARRRQVDEALDTTIERVRARVFRFHGL